jgi:hypothetical protein
MASEKIAFLMLDEQDYSCQEMKQTSYPRVKRCWWEVAGVV